MMSKSVTNIANDIGGLVSLLEGAFETAQEVYEAGATRNNINEAIGRLVPLMEKLEACTALGNSILAQHRLKSNQAA